MKPKGLGRFGGLGLQLALQAPGLLRLRFPLERSQEQIPFPLE